MTRTYVRRVPSASRATVGQHAAPRPRLHCQCRHGGGEIAAALGAEKSSSPTSRTSAETRAPTSLRSQSATSLASWRCKPRAAPESSGCIFRDALVYCMHAFRSTRRVLAALGVDSPTEALGCEVTQATVSRDIRELDLQKVRTHLGRAKYILSSRERPKNPEQAAKHVLRDFARSIVVAGNLVVVRCDIGTASTVARQIDNLNHADVLGTLAGEDTFIVVAQHAETAHEIRRFLDRLREA